MAQRLVPTYTSNLRIKNFPLLDIREYGSVHKNLGAGGFGSVFQFCRGVCIPENSVAIKRSAINEGITDVIEESLLHEVVALMRTNHPNIVTLIDIAFDSRNLEFVLVFPLASGTLEDYAALPGPYNNFSKGKIDKSLDVRQVGIVIYQLSRAFAYLESVDVRHRDIKPANVLVYWQACDHNPHLRVVLADFGLSRVGLCAYATETLVRVGTELYMAPELLLGGTYTRSSDIWSLGCIAYELLTREIVGSDNFDDHIIEIMRLRGTPAAYDWPAMRGFPDWSPEFDNIQVVPQLINRIDPNIRPLIERMLQIVPSCRPSGAQLVHDANLQLLAKDWVETCDPAPEARQLNCEQEAISNTEGERIYPPNGMVRAIRLGTIELIETVVSKLNGHLRDFFLAQTIIDRYFERNRTFDITNPTLLTLCIYLCVYIARQLVNETTRISLQSPYIQSAITEIGENNFKEMQIDILRRLRFNVMVGTMYDLVSARSDYYQQRTIEVAILFLRVAARSMLVYVTSLQDIADLCMIMACAYTGEMCKGDIRFLAQRLAQYKPIFYEGVRDVLSNPESAARLLTPTERLIDIIKKSPEAVTYFGGIFG